MVMTMPRLMVGRVHPVGRNLTKQLIYISVVTYRTKLSNKWSIYIYIYIHLNLILLILVAP